MSRMKISDLRSKTDQELEKFVSEQRQALAQAFVDLKTKEVKHVRLVRSIKKDIARALTLKSERELQALEASHE